MGTRLVRTTDAARASVVVFIVLAVQLTLIDAVRITGAHADAMILLAVAAGYVGGPERGATFGFAAGLVADLFLPTTFGLSALVFCLVGFATGLATEGLVRSSWWLPPLVAAAATAAGAAGYAILGALLGTPGMLSVDLVPTLVVAVPGAAILATPVLRMVAWAVPARTAASGGAAAGGMR